MTHPIFIYDGDPVFNGIWKTITTARAFNDLLLNPSKMVPNATHWMRYTTGSVAALRVGEVLTGGTSNETCTLVGQVIEQGTTGGSNEEGVIFINRISGTLTAAGETFTGTSTGTVLTAQAPIPCPVLTEAKSALISVETAAINFTFNGIKPTATAGTNFGHYLDVGGSYELRGWNALKNFYCINAVNASGAIVKYTIRF